MDAKKAHGYIARKLSKQDKNEDTEILEYINLVFQQRIIQEEVAKELNASSIPTVLAVINSRQSTYDALKKMKDNPNTFGGCFWTVL